MEKNHANCETWCSWAKLYEPIVPLYIQTFLGFLLLTKISEYVSIQLTIYTQPEDNHNKFEVYTLYSYSVTNKGVIKSHKTLLQGNDKTW